MQKSILLILFSFGFIWVNAQNSPVVNYKLVFDQVVKNDANPSMTVEKRKGNELYRENHLHPTLDKLKNEMSTKYDEDVMHSFFGMILNTQNSADEYPSYCLGKIFIKKPTEVMNSILEFDDGKKRLTLFKLLEFGYLNAKPLKCTQQDSVLLELKKHILKK